MAVSCSSASGMTAPISGQRPRVADAGHHVLALGVHEELAVEDVLAGGGVTGEGHTGAGGLALVAEDHALHVDGRAQVVGDVVELPVDLGAVVVPAAEDRPHRQVELLPRIRREAGASVLLQEGLEADAEVLEVFGGEIRVVGGVDLVLLGRERVLELLRVDAQTPRRRTC